MDSYPQVLEKNFALAKARGMNRSLTNIENFCKIYNNPERAFPTIHVAGTNGKGSVCTKIAACLQAEGYKTGLYTSPHISTFRERIQVDKQMISEKEFSSLMSEITQHNIPATFFEIATFLAFLHFQRMGVDVAVIETGLGGQWDATNVITPLISVITSIGYDHMDILGPTLEEIAEAKAGIIKKGVPVVIGPDVPFAFMKARADQLTSPLYQSSYEDENFDCENQETARLALSVLKYFPVSEHSIQTGLAAKPPCRFESHVGKKQVILDVAHNSHGIARLLQMLKYTYPDHNYRFVIGFSKGKDISECAQLIQDNAHAIHLVSGPHPRLATVQEFQPFFPTAKRENTISQGIENALDAPNSKQEVVVITGSFFIMAEARKALGINAPEDPGIWYDPLKVIC
jgi:dihydrofolate synthase/folylpolyglutamate synthase